MKLPIILFGLLATGLGPCAFALDQNGNGMCDVWEARFAVGTLNPDEDANGDGQSNRAESIAGTNPFKQGGGFRVETLTVGSGVAVKVASVVGKRYQLQSAPSPAGPWTAVGQPVSASASLAELQTQSVRSQSDFFRVTVTDVDSDSDGLSDWAEQQLEGFNPQNSDSFSSNIANADSTAAATWLSHLANGGFQVSAVDPDGFEKEAAPARVTLSRPAPFDRPFTVFLRPAPPSASTVGSADASDFILKSDSAELTDRVVIPAGQGSVDVWFTPVGDAFVEVPEEARFHVGGSAAQLAARICDARPISANVKLLVAYLSPRPGVSSLGSGLAAIQLAGDNSTANVVVNFSNLSSLASSAHIETSSGGTILSVPPFRYNGQPWNIRASQSFTKDQQVLDALLSGSFRFNVYSEMQVSGEIAGAFGSVNGSTAFQLPPAPVPVSSVSGDDLDREIVRFLTQATFGARLEDIVAMRRRVNALGGDRLAAFEQWINEQMLLTAPSHEKMTAAGNALERSADPTLSLFQSSRRVAWWTIALNAPDQLRQRMAYALSQIFVISDEEPTLDRMGSAIASYYDMLQDRSFSNYRSLIEDVTLNPNMGQYLSHLRNEKTKVVSGVTLASPDENYAREIMQLFSIGLVKIHPDHSLVLGPDGLPQPTYSQEDITELAKVFTGWSFSKRAASTSSLVVNDNTNFFLSSSFEEHAIRWMYPMKLFPPYHDEGAKSFLGLSIPARVGGGQQDLSDTLDLLANHANTAPFIGRQLIQRFTTANPSAGYVYRVSTAFTQSGGNLGTTLKALLLDPEVRNLASANSSVGTGKIKEPLIRHAALLRALEAKSAIPLVLLNNFSYPLSETAKFPAGTQMARYQDTFTGLAQKPLGAPSVFNWYRPDYAPAGILSQNGLVSPEFQIVNETTVTRAINYHYSPIYDSNGQSTDNLPSGLNISGVPDFPSYTSNSDNMVPDYSQFRQVYLSVLDTNNDGLFSSADSTWVDRVAKIAEAVEKVVDRADLLLCAGSMKARYGNTAGKPRRIIIDAVTSIESQNISSTSTTTQTSSMNERIRDAIYLITKSSDFIIQK
jgi:uncharacterized protein (DUF1800 family)